MKYDTFHAQRQFKGIYINKKQSKTNRIKVVNFYVDGCLHKIQENTNEIVDLRLEDSGDYTAWNMMHITDAAGSFLKGE